jgi:type I restriction enzyme S subunit
MKLQRLGDIVKNLDSKRIPLNSEERIAKSKKGLYPYIGANNIVGYIDEYIFNEKILCVAEDGGNWGANQKCAVIYEGKTWVNNHAHVLVENGNANLEYLKNYLNYTNLNKHIKGATRGKLNKSVLENLLIPVPSLPDQLHIANLLSKAENLIAQRKESIRLLDEFLKSTFLEMFGDPVRNEKGWEKVVLGNVCGKIGSGSTPRGGKESYHSEGISLIRSLNVHNDTFVYKDLAFIDDKQAHELRNVIIEENDVLLNITGASVARCCIVPKEILPARVNQHVSIIRPDANILNPRFLSRMFTCENYQLKLVKDAKSKGATREAITKEELELMKVIAPPKQLQTQFAQIVEKTEALKTQYQQSLQELENLYGSLSQKAFKGELNINDESLLMAAEPLTKYGE